MVSSRAACTPTSCSGTCTGSQNSGTRYPVRCDQQPAGRRVSPPPAAPRSRRAFAVACRSRLPMPSRYPVHPWRRACPLASVGPSDPNRARRRATIAHVPACRCSWRARQRPQPHLRGRCVRSSRTLRGRCSALFPEAAKTSAPVVCADCASPATPTTRSKCRP